MPNFLFSTNTKLSFFLGEQYYGGKHFVWCSLHFELSHQSGFIPATPPTSTPKDIYQSLWLEVERSDRHSAKIKSSRSGLLKGAKLNLSKGMISQSQFDDIRYMVSAAPIADFQPLLYVINYQAVSRDLIEVPLNRRANPYCPEFQLAQVNRSNFEPLELPKMRI